MLVCLLDSNLSSIDASAASKESNENNTLENWAKNLSATVRQTYDANVYVFQDRGTDCKGSYA